MVSLCVGRCLQMSPTHPSYSGVRQGPRGRLSHHLFRGEGGLRIISCDTYFLYRSRAETLGPGVGIWAKVAVERSNQRR